MELIIKTPTQYHDQLQRAFAVLCRKLDLEDDVTIFLEIFSEPTKKGMFTGGETGPHWLPGPNKAIPMRLNEEKGIHIMLLGFSHEMVHVQQMVKGWLSQADGIITWKGTPSQIRVVNFGLKLMGRSFYEIIPWERDALVRQTDLYKAVEKELFPGQPPAAIDIAEHH